MKRSEFLKKLGLGLGVAVVAPTVFAEKDNFTPSADTRALVRAKARRNGSSIILSPEFIKVMDDTSKAWLEYQTHMARMMAKMTIAP